jgi:N6-L-threonylcarbamoyladenine synthase
MYFLGIDASCYTSSIAIVDREENVIFDGRIVLEVGAHEKGLRQSDAIFQHMNNLPKLLSEAMNIVDPSKISGIGVSTRPRKVEGSYMPVFTAGYNFAKVIASSIKVPIIECSHQQSHIVAGTWSINKEYTDSHLVYHISGGTTELLKVDNIDSEIEVIGGSEDLNAGQYIDRIGVALGFKFPCGKEMDKLCSSYDGEIINLPLSIKDTYLSFSGPESHVQRLLKKDIDQSENYRAQLIISVFSNIAKALEKTILNACKNYKIKDVLLVGGVASNSVISKILQNSSKINTAGINISISKPQYSSDNAVGAAIYAKRA